MSTIHEREALDVRTDETIEHGVREELHARHSAHCLGVHRRQATRASSEADSIGNSVVVLRWQRGRVAVEGGDVAEELVLPGEGGATGADPSVAAAVLLVRAQVGEHGEALDVAPAAGVALVAVAPAVVVLDADGRLERLEAPVLPVALAPDEGAGVEAPGQRGRRRGGGLGERRRRLVLLAVAAHVHAQVGVALEALAADLARVHVRRQDLLLAELDHLVGAGRWHAAIAVAVAVAVVVLGVEEVMVGRVAVAVVRGRRSGGAVVLVRRRGPAATGRGEALGDGDELHGDAAELGRHHLPRRARRRADDGAEVRDLLLQECEARQHRRRVVVGAAPGLALLALLLSLHGIIAKIANLHDDVNRSMADLAS